MSTAKKICTKRVKKIIPYNSARSINLDGDIWINANESYKNTCCNLHLENLNRYPDFQSSELLNAYSNYCGQLPQNLLITRGADEGIDLLIRTYCEASQDCILIPFPTYGMYTVSAASYGITTSNIPLFRDKKGMLTLKIEAVPNNCKIIFLCHPNNPTGEIYSVESIAFLANKMQNRSLVVIDEAYIEYSLDKDVSNLIKEHDNLVVLRTLSKAFAMAALRCGFVIADKTIIQQLKKIIAPYPLPAPVTTIATQKFSAKKLQEIKKTVIETNSTKKGFIQEMGKISFVVKIYPSYANFVLVEFNNSQIIWSYLLKNKIIARDFSSNPALKNCIRFTIGSSKEMDLIIKKLIELDKTEAFSK